MHRQMKSMATFPYIRKYCTVGGQWRSPPTHRIFNCTHVETHPLCISLMFAWDQLHLQIQLWARSACVCTPTHVDLTSKHAHKPSLSVTWKHFRIWATQRCSKDTDLWMNCEDMCISVFSQKCALNILLLAQRKISCDKYMDLIFADVVNK